MITMQSNYSNYLYTVQVLFKETQRFTQWWLWLIIIGVSAICTVPFFMGGMDNYPVYVIAITVGTPLLIMILFAALELTTTITTEHIIIKYRPFLKRTFPLSEIASAQVIDYGFVGGWGIRIWTGYGTVYNVKGSMGLHLKLKSGKERIVGTQRAAELKNTMQKIQEDGGYDW